MNIGDSVGVINKISKNGEELWVLVEDKVNKIAITKKYGKRYYTKSKFRPLDANNVDANTRIMEDAVNEGYIFVREVFELNDVTRPFAENWVMWANENMHKIKL